MRLNAKWFLWLGVFALLGVLGLWMEHERAAAQTRARKEALEAKGERLSYTNHIPPMPPAASNGAVDFHRAAGDLTTLKNEFFPWRMKLLAPARARVSWQQETLPTEKEPDLWPFLAAYVEDNRAALAEIHAALERPVVVTSLQYEKTYAMLLPHLSTMKGAGAALATAALWDLRNGDTDAAFTNLLASIRTGSRLREPVMISQLVRIACEHIAISTTWEALQHPGWSDARLAALQRAWEEFDLREGVIGAMNMERAMGMAIVAQCRTNFAAFRMLGSPGGGSGPPPSPTDLAEELWIKAWWPAWSSYGDERWMLDRHQIYLDAVRFAFATNAYATATVQMQTAVAAQGEPAARHILSRILVPAMENCFKKVASYESSRRLTVTALALHRHKLRHGSFPPDLAALVPEFLAEVPRDFMDGRPLRYRLLPDGQFLLWSVGDDFKDDGGDGTTPPGSSPGARVWTQGRDLVWPLPASAAEVAADNAYMESKRLKLP